MASPNDLLAALKEALATLPGISTLKIGIEEGLTADDYPLIRLVPTLLRQEPSIRGEVLEVIIYYGQLAYPFADGGLEAQYTWLLDMEQTIKATVRSGQDHFADWQDTVLDEDRLPGYKLFASRFVVQ